MISDESYWTIQRESLWTPSQYHELLKYQYLFLFVSQDIVTEYLGKFNKKLDEDQMICLLEKSSSANPLWLSVACEELRVYGEFRKIDQKINTLSDGLLEWVILTLFCPTSQRSCGRGILDYPSAVRPSVRLCPPSQRSCVKSEFNDIAHRAVTWWLSETALCTGRLTLFMTYFWTYLTYFFLKIWLLPK